VEMPACLTNEFTRALGNAYGGDARLLKCLGNQRISLFKEGLGYYPQERQGGLHTSQD
jgi:hypothetical protein